MHLVVQSLVGYKFEMDLFQPTEVIPYFTCDHHKHLGSEAQASLFSYRRLSWNERMKLCGLLTTLCHPYTFTRI
uniref:Uncharacterized protein n=1 Tax=Oryza meridionalis TaxID=40149 RepID=A0A0E0DS43_9ORYZ